MHRKLWSIGVCLVAGALLGGWGACSPAPDSESAEPSSGSEAAAEESTAEAAEAGSEPAVDEGPADAARQKQTLADMRNLGTAVMTWLTDQVSAAAAGQATNVASYDLSGLPVTSAADLEELLVPTYIQELPTEDGWGNPLEFRLAENVMAAQVFSVRSPGRDGEWDVEEGEYEVAPFEPTDYGRDIVWADGFFVRWPGREP